MTCPLVSVIIPVHNGAQYLPEAIESVLAQTYPDLEIMVMDDGSTDRSAEIARSYQPRVCVLTQEHAGAAAARNRAIRIASGNYLAFLDADDIWQPDKLMRQMTAFACHPDVEMVTGLVQQFITPEIDATTMRGITCPAQPVPGYIPSAITVTRDAFERVGPFDEQCMTGEFLSWGIRAVEQLHITMLPVLVTRRRIHPAHQRGRSLQVNQDILRLLKASLDRRRGGQA